MAALTNQARYYRFSRSAVMILSHSHRGWRLYAGLIGLTTVEVIDPDNSGERLGIIGGGHAWTDAELAVRLDYEDVWRLRRDKKALLQLGLLIQSRSQHSYRLAIRHSDKHIRQQDFSCYAWLADALYDASRIAETGNSECESRIAEISNSGYKTSNSGYRISNSQSGSGLRSQQHSGREIIDEIRVERREQDQHQNPPSRADSYKMKETVPVLNSPSPNNTQVESVPCPAKEREPTPSPKSLPCPATGLKAPPAPDRLEKFCDDMARFASEECEVTIACCTITGKSKQSIIDLAKTYSLAEIWQAWEEYLGTCNKGDARDLKYGVPQFCSGAGTILRVQREVAEEERLQEEAEKRKKHQEDIACQVCVLRSHRVDAALAERDAYAQAHGADDGFVPTDRDAFEVGIAREVWVAIKSDPGTKFGQILAAENNYHRLEGLLFTAMRADPLVIAAAEAALASQAPSARETTPQLQPPPPPQPKAMPEPEPEPVLQFQQYDGPTPDDPWDWS